MRKSETEIEAAREREGERGRGRDADSETDRQGQREIWRDGREQDKSKTNNTVQMLIVKEKS